MMTFQTTPVLTLAASKHQDAHVFWQINAVFFGFSSSISGKEEGKTKSGKSLL